MSPIPVNLFTGISAPVLGIWVNTGNGCEQLSDQPVNSAASAPKSNTTEQIGAIPSGRVPVWNGTSLVNSMILDTGVNVGIGIAAPTTKLQVAGIIQSTTGGIRFPDGSIQITVKLTGPQGPSGPQGAQAHPARERRRGQHMGE